MSSTVDVLSQSRLFSSLNADQFTQLLARSSNRSESAGNYIAREDEKGNEIWLLLSGMEQAEIQVTGIEKPEVLGAFGAGDIVGEMSVLGLYRRSASIKIIEDAEMLSWRGPDLDELFSQDPRIGYAVMRNFATSLCARLNNANLEIERLLIEKSLG